ncbi:unnamed protein product [Chondrus crispus]|uniref:RING-type domain-containing protein n=1 Tax=Chondrus crispus TaxID=2769 RepID=R7QUX9_CHOCR|nr:unnamed protein product [Chondrus crispus]CDF41286.1 unnamed protein product [Chondrus crispus]|eukprot:XP_005711580.1 unnamed protein product [Chondrus crispus]
MTSLNPPTHHVVDLAVASSETPQPAPNNDVVSESDTDSETLATEPSARLSTRVKFVLSILLLLISFACISFTIVNWSRYEARRRDYEWNEHTCTRLAKRATKDPTRNAHRIEVTVTGLPSRESKEVVAFDGPTSDYTLTGSQAEEKLGHIKEGRGPCWVKRSDESRVSISEVDDDPEAVSRGRRALYIAWTTTFLAAVFGMMTLILGSHWIGDLGHQGDTQEEEEKAKGMLNREQAKFVCERFSSDSKAEEGGWTCSVCLDGSAEEGRTALVNLPCEHRFHMQCIKKWLRRGKSACPLCKWDARTLFDVDGQPQAEGVGADTERETAVDIESGETSADAR